MSAVRESLNEVPVRYRPLVSQCIDIADRLAAHDLCEDVLRGIEETYSPVRIGILGEQSTKAPVINALVGTDALDPVRGHGRIRRITAGSEDRLAPTAGERTELPLDSESWARVERLSPSVDVAVEVDSDTLVRLHADLIDFALSRDLRVGGADWRALQLCHPSF